MMSPTTLRRLAIVALAPISLLAQQKPTARQVLDAHATAVGGVAAFRALAGITMRGTIDITFAGLTGPYQSRIADGRAFLSFDIGPAGTISQGFDGTVAWSVDPNSGARKLTGEDLAAARNAATTTAGLYPEGSYTAAEVLDEAQFEGKACWPVRLTLTSGRVATVYYDKATGLKAGQVATNNGTELKVVFDDYQQFGAVKMATKQVRGSPNGDIIITTPTITFDAIDPTVFALPEAVKSLP